MFRKIVFWLHLGTGATIGVLVLIMSATGVLLTYQKQMQSWADLRGLDGAPPAANQAPLPVSQILARVAEAVPGKPTAVRWRPAADAPVEVVFGAGRSVFLNAYTGEVLGTGAQWLRSFFHTMTDWHRWLGLDGAARERGRMINSIANAAFLFIVISGFFLWWPRNWAGPALRSVMLFRRGLRPKARDFNWHNVIGFWSALPLFIVIASGVVISFPQVGSVIDRLAAESPPARSGRGAQQRTASVQTADATTDSLVVLAKTRDPQWRLLTMQLEQTRAGGISFTIDRSLGGRPQDRAQLVLASGTGEVLRWEPFSEVSRARQLRSVVRFAHTGEVAGVLGQTIAGLVSAGALVLVYTGVSLALRRFVAWRRRAGSIGSAAQPATPSDL